MTARSICNIYNSKDNFEALDECTVRLIVVLGACLFPILKRVFFSDFHYRSLYKILNDFDGF